MYWIAFAILFVKLNSYNLPLWKKQSYYSFLLISASWSSGRFGAQVPDANKEKLSLLGQQERLAEMESPVRGR